MSGSQIGGIVGAAIGAVGAYFTGNVALISYGYALGSAAGGLLFPEQLPGQFGPRLQDLKVQASQFGRPIPIDYGNAPRHAGNIIWASDLVEVATTEEVGGKGGGPEGESTTFSYFANFAVLISDCSNNRPIAGIRRIWDTYTANLIYDASDTGSVSAMMASQSLASGIAIYDGSMSQMPDPTMQSYLGAGNVPAYRQRSMVVFSMFPLAKYGNRIPNLEFEVVSNAEADIGPRLIATNPSEPIAFGAGALTNPILLGYDNGVLRVGTYGSVDVYLYDVDLNYLGQDARRTDASGLGRRSEFYPDEITVATTIPNPSFGYYSMRYWPIGIYLDKQLWAETGAVPVGLPGSMQLPLGGASTPEFSGDLFFVAGLPTGEIVDAVLLTPDGTRAFIFTSPPGSAIGGDTISKWYEVTGQVAMQSTIVATGTVSPALSRYNLGFGNSNKNYPTTACAENDGIHFWGMDGVVGLTASLYTISAGNFALMIQMPAFGSTAFFQYPTVFSPSPGFVFAFMGDNAASWTRLPALVPTAPTLASIAADLCTRKNADDELALTLADIDVTQGTDLVTGYTFIPQQTPRGALQQLAQAFYFDMINSDGKIKLVKRGQNPALTIPDDELGAHAPGESIPDLIKITHQQQIEVPYQVTVLYPDQDNSYQIATQSTRRIGNVAGSPASLQLPISMTGAKAKQIADVMRFDSIASQDAYAFSTTIKYAQLEESDVVYVGGRVLRLIDKTQTPDLRIEWKGAAEDARRYSKNYPPASWSPPVVAPGLSGPTMIALLDIPILRDEDDAAGLYLATQGLLPGWRGDRLLRSSDAGASYQSILSTTNETPLGRAVTALGLWAGGNQIDRTNTFTVRLQGDGALSSCTYADLLNGRNAIALKSGIGGWEVLQFQTAALNGDGTYDLSNLLRGRLGTEQFMAHAVGDAWALLSGGSLQRIPESIADINLERLYKPVTMGSSAAVTAAQAFTDAGAALKPYSPVHIRGGKDLAKNITLAWTRRSRLPQSSLLRDFVNVPLGEATEAYSVDVWDSAFTVLQRTIASTTPTCSYSATDSAADFGTSVIPQVGVDVYQISANVGRGYRGRQVVSFPN